MVWLMDVNGTSDEKCLEASPLTLPGDLDLRPKLAQVFPDRIQKLLQRCFHGSHGGLCQRRRSEKHF